MISTVRARRLIALGLVGSLLQVSGCATAEPEAATAPTDALVTHAPYERFFVEFKETLDEQFVCLEDVVPGNDLRSALARFMDALARSGIQPTGPMFVEYLEDPRPLASGAANRPIRVRVGVPVDDAPAGDPDLRYGTSAPRTVVYCKVAGPFGTGRRAFPALDEHMRQWGWVQHGAVREIFEPIGDGGYVTEVQIPWTAGS